MTPRAGALYTQCNCGRSARYPERTALVVARKRDRVQAIPSATAAVELLRCPLVANQAVHGAGRASEQLGLGIPIATLEIERPAVPDSGARGRLRMTLRAHGRKAACDPGIPGPTAPAAPLSTARPRGTRRPGAPSGSGSATVALGIRRREPPTGCEEEHRDDPPEFHTRQPSTAPVSRRPCLVRKRAPRLDACRRVSASTNFFARPCLLTRRAGALYT
jgi:hypothetical protein